MRPKTYEELLTAGNTFREVLGRNITPWPWMQPPA